MIDLRRLRDEPEYRRGIERKRVRAGLIDEVLEADGAHRVIVQEVEALRARQNAASKEIGKAAPDERAAKIEAAGKLKDELAAREQEFQAADARLRELALQVPNPADASVPDGGEDEGEVERVVGGTPPRPRSTTGHSPRRWASSTRSAQRRRAARGSRTSCARARSSSSRS